MNLTPTSRAALGLARYVREIEARLGSDVLTSEWDIAEKLATAVIALKSYVPTLPSWPLVLTWDEINGWALRVQTSADCDTAALAYLGQDILPHPQTVAHFVADAKNGRHPGSLLPPSFRWPTDNDDLPLRLAFFW